MCEKQQWITETPNSSEDQRKNYLREISYTLQAEEREQNEKNLKTAINTTLKEIFSNNQISQYLALKWGIAANYYWLNRESTDIDLDVLDISKYDIIVNEIRKFLEEIGEIRNETTLQSWYRFIAYRKIKGRRARIQIDLNKHIYKSNQYDFQEIDWVPARYMTKNSIFANKLVSLWERLKDTDLYDVNDFLKKNFPLNIEIIKERTNMWPREFIENLITRLLPVNWYYNATLAAKVPRIFHNTNDRNTTWFENDALIQETILLLNKIKNKLTLDQQNI